MNLNQLVAKRALKGDFDASVSFGKNARSQHLISPFESRIFHVKSLTFKNVKWLVLLFGIGLWSCQKEELQDTVIEGRITEFGSFEPVRVGGLRVALYETGSTSIFNSYTTKVAEIVTNENGEFYLETQLNKNPESYFIQLLDGPEDYFLIDNIRVLKSRTLNLVQFNLNKETWLKLILNNEGGGQFDYFVFSINGRAYTHTGGGRPSVIQRVPSFDTCRIPFADHRTNPVTVRYFSPVLPPNDTTEFEIDLRQQ